MATKFECDVCKEQFNASHQVRDVNLPHPENNYKYKSDYNKDWCDGCLGKLRDFVEGLHQAGLVKKA